MNGTDAKLEATELLVFELAGLRLALELHCVREVFAAVLITPLPGAPPVVEGIIDVRGQVVPVYGIRQRFGLPAAALHPDQRIVTAWTGERLVALRCDRVDWIETAPPDRISTAEPLLQAERRIAGVARLPGGLTLIQDLAAFLDDAERTALEQAMLARASDG